MKGTQPRILAIVTALLLFLSPLSALGTDAGLKKGDKGEEVRALLLRLFDLGYLQSVKDAGDAYTARLSGYVRAFQGRNSLPETGEADASTLQAIYSGDAVKAPLPEDRPLYNIDPDEAPSVYPEDLPLTDELGFLPAGSKPYLFKDRDAGYWRYLSDRLSVEITRFYQSEGQIEWFEAYIRTREGGGPYSIESRRDGKATESPLKMVEREGAVFAVTDDYYQYRVRNDQRVGIVVRDGEIRSDRTYTQRRSRIPSLEVLALFADGTMKTFASDAHTAQEYLDMGVRDAWAFGPALVQEGEVPRYFYSKDYRSYREPRCALGMIAPGEYCALVITGRKTGSRGATFGWMAEKMQAMGAVEALNLDGGGTAAMVFDGELLNHSESNQTTRAVTGLIGFR